MHSKQFAFPCMTFCVCAVKLQMLWISWKCDAFFTIAFPCMTFRIYCELICSAGRACALLPQSYPFLFSKEEKRVNVRAIEFFTKLVARIFQRWKTSSSSTWKGVLNLLQSTGVLWKHEAWKGESSCLIDRLSLEAFWSIYLTNCWSFERWLKLVS